MNGTSMAAPHVAGAWAILKESTPFATTVSQVLNTLQTTGLKITDPANGLTQCRIRIFQALNRLPAALTTIDVPSARDTEASGINNSGQIVGTFDVGGLTSRRFLVSPRISQVISPRSMRPAPPRLSPPESTTLVRSWDS